MILSMLLCWVFFYDSIICESGERVTDQFDQFGQEVERCEWNKLPIEMQRMYLIFLSDTQQPVNIRSYGGIICSRDTFKMVRIDLQIMRAGLYYQFDNLFFNFIIDNKYWLVLFYDTSSI